MRAFIFDFKKIGNDFVDPEAVIVHLIGFRSSLSDQFALWESSLLADIPARKLLIVQENSYSYRIAASTPFDSGVRVTWLTSNTGGTRGTYAQSNLLSIGPSVARTNSIRMMSPETPALDIRRQAVAYNIANFWSRPILEQAQKVYKFALLFEDILVRTNHPYRYVYDSVIPGWVAATGSTLNVSHKERALLAAHVYCRLIPQSGDAFTLYGLFLREALNARIRSALLSSPSERSFRRGIRREFESLLEANRSITHYQTGTAPITEQVIRPNAPTVNLQDLPMNPATPEGALPPSSTRRRNQAAEFHAMVQTHEQEFRQEVEQVALQGIPTFARQNR